MAIIWRFVRSDSCGFHRLPEEAGGSVLEWRAKGGSGAPEFVLGGSEAVYHAFGETEVLSELAP